MNASTAIAILTAGPICKLCLDGRMALAFGVVAASRQCHNCPRHVDARKIKVAVLGTGSLGKEHVRIYAGLASAGVVSFAGIYDVASETARKLAEKYQVRQFGSIQEAVEASDALNIVT